MDEGGTEVRVGSRNFQKLPPRKQRDDDSLWPTPLTAACTALPRNIHALQRPPFTLTQPPSPETTMATQTLHGACACGRNRYVVELPSQHLDQAELRYDNTSASRMSRLCGLLWGASY